MNSIDKFLKLYSYKFNKGYPDMNDEQDILLLENILQDLNIIELRKIEPKLNDEVIKIFDLRNSINSKKSYGGTSFENIKKMIMKYKKYI